MNNRNLTVDVLRLAAALEVILLHVDFDGLPTLAPIAIRLQARWAVPFFFIISGYYLARRLDDPDRPSMLASVHRMIWVFGLWTLIYLPLVLYQHDLREIFRRLLLPEFVYTGSFFHLWFPSSLVLGFLIVLFCRHYRLERLAPWVSILILVHILMAGSYDIFEIKFPFDFDTARHWLSIPCLFLGMWLYRRGPLARWAALALLLGGMILQAVEAYLLLTRFNVSAYDHEVLLGTLPAALGAASLGISGLRWLDSPVLAGWGKEYSLGIYLLHPLMAFSISSLTARMIVPATLLPMVQILFPFTILIACIGFFAWIRHGLPAVFAWLFGSHLDQRKD
jgi:peptidoglycan/LPS O-acetylase OafA/YrhL